MLVAAIVLGACGCGRVGFTSASDSAGQDAAAFNDAALADGLRLFGHDEDGDGLPDVVDNCPHIANVLQTNSDGDQAGDACDSFPTTHNTLRFYSLVTADLNDPAAEINGTWIKGDDFWTANDPVNANLHIVGPTGTSEIFIGYNVISVLDAAANHELSVRAENTMLEAYYYGHYRSRDQTEASISNAFHDGAGNYESLANSSATGRLFATGPATLAVRFDTTAKEIRTRFVNASGSYEVVSPATLLASMNHYHLDAVGVEVKVLYFAIVGE